jgi:DNA invertase Pin-like site-specific DNA recombinase
MSGQSRRATSLPQALAACRTGDTLVVATLDRLDRLDYEMALR